VYALTTDASGLSKIINFLKENPKHRETLRLALDHEERNKDNKDYKGWEWHDVRINPPELPKLVNERLVDIKYKSKRYTNYLLSR